MEDERRQPPSLREIGQALREKLRLNLYELPTSRLPPTIFHVYLHSGDYGELEYLFARATEELSKDLTREVARMNEEIEANRRSWWRSPDRWLRRLLGGEKDELPIEMPAVWHIDLIEDQNGVTSLGQFDIQVKLGMPPTAVYDGVETVGTVTASNGRRVSASRPSLAVTATAPEPSSPGESEPPVAPKIVLSYRDDAGTHETALQQSVITIGRGTNRGAVDVTIASQDDTISREHCRISYIQRRFVITDLSAWGTSVNGTSIPEALRSPEGAFLGPGTEYELPATARIGLAKALLLDFRIEGAP